jgi:hypothetical protein
MAHRATIWRAHGPLFLSESRRNHAQPLSLLTWSKVIRRIAIAAEAPRFSTHTTRHLCLTDLARRGWELHAIATFAGHRNTGSTLTYIHLSGRDLAAKLNRGMEQIHGWRGGLTMTALLQASAVATDAARSWSWPVRPVRYDRHPEFTATEREALVCLGTDLRRRTGGYDAQASQWETVGRLLRHSTSCAHRCGFPMAAGTAVGSTTPSPWFSCGLSSTAGRSGPGRPRIGSP